MKRQLYWTTITVCALGLAVALFPRPTPAQAAEAVRLLNVSYDPTRELYKDINPEFIKYWKAKTGADVVIDQSHGGSAKQAGSVIQGNQADVVTLGLAYDIDALYDHGKLVPSNWQDRLPEHSAPYTSTIIFLVRAGNPKKIVDWDDLVHPGVGIVMPNPKTSSGARWTYLAAYGYALKKNNGDTNAAYKFIDQFFRNVVAMGAGARDSTIAFAKNGIGDVMVSWENEAQMARSQFGKGQLQIVYPSLSVAAEPPVAVVDKYATQHGTQQLAEAYLRFLYEPASQEIIARHFLRPRDQKILLEHREQFPPLETFTVDELFGGWRRAQKIHFDDGGLFDQISRNRR